MTEKIAPSPYRSAAELRYHIYTEAMREFTGADFVSIVMDIRTGRVKPTLARDIGKWERVILSLDVSEHAYFADYGFRREDYIRAAVSRLDLKRIAECFEKKQKNSESGDKF